MKSKSAGRSEIIRIALIVGYLISIFVILETQVNAQPIEKPLILKGMSIDMDIHEAKKILDRLLSKDWNVSAVTEKANRWKLIDSDQLRKVASADQIDVDDYFDKNGKIILIQKSGSYTGFINADELSNKVTRIIFRGELTDYIFSTSEISTEVFVTALRDHFKMPEFEGIAFKGWIYRSPYNYVLTISNYSHNSVKRLDIKKDITPINKVLINFD